MGKVRVIGGMDLRNACAPVFIAAIPYCGIAKYEKSPDVHLWMNG